MSLTPRRLAALTAALAFALGLSGCFVTAGRSLPPDWPQRVARASGDCPDVNGRWEAWSEEDPFTWERVELAPHLGAAQARPDPGRGPADWVDLVQPDADTLIVRSGLAGEGGGEAVTLRRGEGFECEGGALRVARHGQWENANLCTGKEWSITTLWRDVRGGLISQGSGRAVCIGPGTFVAWSTSWFRYLPAAPWPKPKARAGQPRHTPQRSMAFRTGRKPSAS